MQDDWKNIDDQSEPSDDGRASKHFRRDKISKLLKRITRTAYGGAKPPEPEEDIEKRILEKKYQGIGHYKGASKNDPKGQDQQRKPAGDA